MVIKKFLHFCLLLEKNGRRMLIDPGAFSFIERKIKPEDIGPVDAILITHRHWDHHDPTALKKILIKTHKKREIVDITDVVNENLGKDVDICHLFLTHTTAALTTADLDTGTDLDMLDAFEAMIPKLKYRHPHDPSHVGDHILSSLIGASLTIPVKDGKLVLGTWQRVVLVEFDGPKERELIIF